MSNWSLVESLTHHMIRPRLGDPSPPYLWPSEASATVVVNGQSQHIGKCRRAVFLRHASDRFRFNPGQYAGLAPIVHEAGAVRSKPDNYMIWIWKQGEIFEEIMVETVKSLGLFVQDQVQVFYPGVNVRGKIDLVAINPVSGLKTAVEFKSVYGYNANSVLGTPAAQRKGELGKPRDSNLMQIALYQNQYKDNPDFESGRLIYGSRDTGRTAEYLIDVDAQGRISYQGVYPVKTKPTVVPYIVPDILASYEEINKYIESGTLPARDFDLQYTQERVLGMFDRGELGKTDSAQIEKYRARLVENQERQAQGQKPLKVLVLPEKGDWECSYCNMKNFCYDQDGNPRN